MTEKFIAYTICGPPDYKKREVWWSGPVFDEKKLFPWKFRSADPPDVTRLAPEPANPPQAPVKLEYSCRQCGNFSFIPVDLCDYCLKIEKKKGKTKEAKKAAPITLPPKSPPKMLFEEPETTFEKLPIAEVEIKKKLMNSVYYEYLELLIPDVKELKKETEIEKENRLARLKKLKSEYDRLSDLIGYNIQLYLESSRPNIYNSSSG